MDIRKHKDKPQRLRVITGEIFNRSNAAKEDDGHEKEGNGEDKKIRIATKLSMVGRSDGIGNIETDE